MIHFHKKTTFTRLIALLLAMSMLLLMTGCSSKGNDHNKSSVSKDTSGTNPPAWIDSNILGNVNANTPADVKKDFALTVNKEWIVSLDGKQADKIADMTKVVLNKKKALLSDPSVTGKTADEIRKYADLASDWDHRDAQGVNPIKPYLDTIDQIGSKEELYAYFCDTHKNPMGLAPIMMDGSRGSKENRAQNITTLKHLGFTLIDPNHPTTDYYFNIAQESAMERKEIIDGKTQYLFKRLGYSDGDINRLLTDTYGIEKKFILALNENWNNTNQAENKYVFDKKTVLDAAGHYPLESYLKNRGHEKSEKISLDIAYLKKLDGICSGNLGAIKSMLKVQTALTCGDYLDKETHDAFTNLEKSRTKEDKPMTDDEETKANKLLFDQYIGKTALNAGLNQIYVDRYTDPAAYEKLMTMTNRLVKAYRDHIFAGSTWLSDEGKKASIDKIDALKVHVIYPDNNVLDYSNLNIRKKSEGGTFLDAYMAVAYQNDYLKGKIAAMPYDRGFWNPLDNSLSTTMTNSVYNPETNGIYIFAGFLEDPMFRTDMTDEEMYAGIGTTVGHEISHGFDKNGAEYNKDGIKQKWLPDVDQMAFNDRVDKVAAYFSSLKPYANCGLYNGNHVNAEATADMGGMRACLTVAKEDPNFNYKAYFEHYGSAWGCQNTKETEEWLFSHDPHPLAFYRVNVTLQQFDEFNNTFDIKAGDGMYLEPEKRIAIW